MLSNIDYIGEIIDIYDFVEDFVSTDDDDWSVEIDEEYFFYSKSKGVMKFQSKTRS